eukprot:CCRYP_005341-RE/>CCRYP_005341-RE protein AED:0.39 eAED:0.39 QI:0/0/0/1/0/0/3/0/609
MLWGQQITVYTDHKNLMQDALGLTSDRVYRWRLLLEEYYPTIVYIKGIHNTVADAISRLDYGPVTDDRSTWMTFAQCWCYHNTSQQEASLASTQESMNQVVANRNEEDSIYPLTTREIAEAQQQDDSLLNKGYSTQLVENIKVLCKDGKMVIPKNLQHRLRTTVQSHVKKCHSCQVNKRRQTKYGKLPTKLAITNPWEALCVDFIGPYTLKGKDKTQIDFMCITMIDPATSWFEIVELPVSQLQKLDIPMGTKGQRSKDAHVQEQQPYFDKTSATVGNLVNRTWFSRYPRSQYVIYSNGSEFKLHFETLCESYGLKRKPTSVKNPQANAILERVHQTIMAMLRTAKLDMADTISESDIADFLTNAAWAVRSTYHTVLTTSPGAAIFGRDMLFDVPYIADWTKIGEYRQRQTDPEEDPSPVQHSDLMNFVFANRSEQNAIYPLTVREIAAAQHTDKTLDKLSLLEAYKPQLVENVQVLCKDGKLVVPQELQQRAVRWYHHYLQHPGTTRLTEALRAVMYWKGLRHSVGTFVKNCHKCQVNKRRQRKYGKLPTKLVVSNPWEVLCVDLIGSYTLKGKDGTEIDFMCVTMIDPATSWFKIVELPVTVCYSQG